MNSLIIEGSDIWGIYEKYYTNVLSKENFKILAEQDPTGKNNTKGKYLVWIINNVLKKIKGHEDILFNGNLYDFMPSELNALKSNLAWYDSHKNYIDEEYRDINRLSLDTLFALVKQSKDVTFTKKESQNMYDVIYKDDEWEVYEPHTYEASRYLVWSKFGGATWCTAAEGENGKNTFNRYVEDGEKLHILHNLNTNEIYQFSTQSKEFKDKNNEDVDNIDLSEGLIEWYEKNYNEDITAYISMDDYVIYDTNGRYFCYLKDGVLYDEEKNKIKEGYEDYVYDTHGTTLKLYTKKGGTDIYDFLTASLIEEDLRQVNTFDLYEDNNYTTIALTHDGYVIQINMENSRCDKTEDNDFTYIHYPLDKDDVFLVYDNVLNCYALASVYIDGLIIDDAVVYDGEKYPIEEDEDDYETIYYYHKEHGDIIPYKCNYYDGECDVYNESDDIEGDEEIEAAPTPTANENVDKQKNIIKEDFIQMYNRMLNADKNFLSDKFL